MREFEGLSYEEIAEVLECPIGTVRSRIFRAREAIDAKVAAQLREFGLKEIDNQETSTGLHLASEEKNHDIVDDEAKDAKSMSTERRALESVSALIDGEANDLDLARALKGGNESETMRAYWQRQRSIVRSCDQGPRPTVRWM